MARRSGLRRRLVDEALDVVVDRAPWLRDQAYRVVAAPLQLIDPVGAARAADARLDAVRDRVAAMAATGRVPRVEGRRIQRDLARTAEDVERIAPRLPPVQARALTMRLAAYVEALRGLPGASGGAAQGSAARATGVRGLRGRSREAVVLGATTVALAGAVNLPLAATAGAVAVEGGIVAGAATAVGVAAARTRRTRRERIAALASTLATVDAATTEPGGTPVRDLDRRRNDLLRRALASKRLDARGDATLRTIGGHLDDLLVRLLADDLPASAAHLVEATVTRYLPDTLEPFLALEDPRSTVRGRPAAVEVADQLASVERALAQARATPTREHPETRLHLQGEFLRSKFGEPPA